MMTSPAHLRRNRLAGSAFASKRRFTRKEAENVAMPKAKKMFGGFRLGLGVIRCNIEVIGCGRNARLHGP